MAITQDDFKKVWASTSSVPKYTFSDSDYQDGWEFVGNLPPTRAMWDTLQRRNDQKMKYLQDNGSMCFDSVADMKSSNLDAGQTAFTKGYYDINDGGAGTYSIRGKVAGETEDGGSVIFLDNGNVAELITDGTVTASVLGLTTNDSNSDNVTRLGNAFDNNLTVIVEKIYALKEAGITTSGDINLIGINGGGFDIQNTTTMLTTDGNVSIKDLRFNKDDLTSKAGFAGAVLTSDTEKRDHIIIENCYRTGNVNIFSTSGDAVRNPAVVDFGYKLIKISNNRSETSYRSLVTINNTPFNELQINNNYCHNLGICFAYISVTNEGAYPSEISQCRRVANIYNNTVENDDDFFDNPSLNNANMHCFVLLEGNVANYYNNYVYGLKTDNKTTAVYHSYLSCNNVSIINNKIINCLNTSPEGDSHQTGAFFMSKAGGGKRIFRGNYCLLEKSWLQTIDRMPVEGVYYSSLVRMIKIQTVWENCVFENNYINAYNLLLGQANDAYYTNIIARNNTIIAEKAYSPIVFYTAYNSGVDYSNVVQIFENNYIDIPGASLLSHPTTLPKVKRVSVKNNTVFNGGTALIFGIHAETLDLVGNEKTISADITGTIIVENSGEMDYGKFISKDNIYSSLATSGRYSLSYGTAIIPAPMVWDNTISWATSSNTSSLGFRFYNAPFDGTYTVSIEGDVMYSDGNEHFSFTMTYGYDSVNSTGYVTYGGTTKNFNGASETVNLPIVSTGDVQYAGVNLYIANNVARLHPFFSSTKNKVAHLKIAVM